MRESDLPVLLHDPLCPLTPIEFLQECVEQAEAEGVIVVGVRPVTDTVRELDGDGFGSTHDRSELRELASPLVIPSALVPELAARPAADLVEALAQLRPLGQVVMVEAPPTARRVRTTDDLPVLAALGEVSRASGIR